MSKLDFSKCNVVKTSPLTLPDGDYTIFSASGEAASDYEIASLEASHNLHTLGNPIGIRHMREAESNLCLKCIKSDKTNELISPEVFKDLPVPVKKQIFEEVRLVSNLRDPSSEIEVVENQIKELQEELKALKEQEEEEGNSLDGTDAG